MCSKGSLSSVEKETVTINDWLILTIKIWGYVTVERVGQAKKSTFVLVTLGARFNLTLMSESVGIRFLSAFGHNEYTFELLCWILKISLEYCQQNKDGNRLDRDWKLFISTHTGKEKEPMLRVREIRKAWWKEEWKSCVRR